MIPTRTTTSPTITRVPILLRWAAAGSVAALGLAGCAPASTGESAGAGSGASVSTIAQAAAGTVFDATEVHTISIDVDEADLTAMIATYLASGDKEWITASVTIDGETFEQVGIKLKGNSSLRSITTDTPAQDLPWRIRLDKYVDGQSVDGYSDFVVRSNSSETALNEAVALELLAASGLATEQSVATRFSVNGSEETLRLTLQNLDDAWVEDNFDDDGGVAAGSVLYKADAEGDYSWRGEDAAAYTEAFDVEAGAEDYAPLVELLDLANNASDEDFAAQLPDLLDVESFATYLAYEDLIGNFDDISGPGNNSYLYYDAATEQFTVVAWDHNLAFGVANVGGGGMPGGGMPGGGELPEGFEPGQLPEGVEPGDLPEGFEPGQRPEGMRPPGAATDGTTGDGAADDDATADGTLDDDAATGGRPGGGGGGMGGGGMTKENALVDRFLADEDFAALYDAALIDLQADLIDSGLLKETVERLAAVLTDGASDLVDPDAITAEAEAIAGFTAGDAAADRGAGGPAAGAPGAGRGTAPSTAPTRDDEDEEAATT